MPAALFVDFCGDRLLNTSIEELEWLHKQGILIPVDIVGLPEGIPVVTRQEDLDRIWNNRPKQLQYQPWSDLCGPPGLPMRQAWYFTAQQYRLLNIKKSFVADIRADEYEMLQSSDQEQIVQISKDIVESLKGQIDEVTSRCCRCDTLVEFLWEAENAIIGYQDAYMKNRHKPTENDLRNVDNYGDMIYWLKKAFHERARDVVGKLRLEKKDFESLHKELISLLVSCVGIVDREAFLASAPPSIWYTSQGLMRLFLDFCRDINIVEIICASALGTSLRPNRLLCIYCASEIPHVQRGRPRVTCSDECAKKLKASHQKKRRTARRNVH